MSASIRTMKQASEAHSIQTKLRQNGIRSLVLKGTVLSQTLYGDPTFRESKDIDLLVDEENLEAAIREIAGDQQLKVVGAPPFNTDRLTLWLDLNKDIKLKLPSGLEIELHHRLAAFPGLLQQIGLDQANTSVQIGPWTFPQFDEAKLFVYLCVHGTTSRWHRLTWLADIKTMLRSASGSDILNWHDHAIEAGVSRPVLVGMVLAHRLWGQPLPPQIVAAANSDPKIRRIVANSITMILDKSYMPTNAIGPGYIGNALLLRDDYAYRRSVLKHLLIDPGQVGNIAIPYQWRLLYVPMRLFLWLKRNLRSVFD